MKFKTLICINTLLGQEKGAEHVIFMFAVWYLVLGRNLSMKCKKEKWCDYDLFTLT